MVFSNDLECLSCICGSAKNDFTDFGSWVGNEVAIVIDGLVELQPIENFCLSLGEGWVIFKVRDLVNRFYVTILTINGNNLVIDFIAVNEVNYSDNFALNLPHR